MMSDRCKSAKYVRLNYSKKKAFVNGVAYFDKHRNTIFGIGCYNERFIEITIDDDERQANLLNRPFFMKNNLNKNNLKHMI